MADNMVHIPVLDLMLTSVCNMRCKYCFEEKKQCRHMDFDEIKPYIDSKNTMRFFLFGGEPLTNPKFLSDLNDYLVDRRGTTRKMNTLFDSSKHMITNGTLLKKNIDLIKKCGMNFQVSVDGDKEVHNHNRVFASGKDTFDIIMENVEFCKERGVEMSFHGVVNRDVISMIKDTTIFLFEKAWEVNGKQSAIDQLARNIYQIVFEEEWTDADIDLLLDKFGEIVDYLWEHPNLSAKERKAATRNFIARTGGMCGAGGGLLSVDTNFNVFPCHRQADNGRLDKVTITMGNLFDSKNLRNFKIYNSFFNIKFAYRFLYGYRYHNRAFKGRYHWFNWCPSTNMYTSNNDNPYYTSSKYVVMHLELARYCDYLLGKYNLR